ncbi:AMP-binding protein [Streptomyces sp. NPDC048612]|uniref:AMP-binding protein n=1 Tax=Streptomyces sp. NPDC048612 TaxID=3365579 RepID=UPI0037161BAB
MVAQQTLSDGGRAGHREPRAYRRRVPQPLPLTLDGMFSSIAGSFPMARAVQEGRHHLSYGEAENRAVQLASALVRGGVQLGDPVIIHCADHRQAVVAQLAVLKAGGVCVPLPAASRGARLDRITRISGARVVLCSTVTRPVWSYRLMSWVLDDPATWSGIAAQRPDRSLPRSGHTEAAYLLVSATDRQGVSGYLTDHRAWQQTLSARIRRVGGAHDGVMVHHPPVRTTTLPAMWWAFACGGTLHVPSRHGGATCSPAPERQAAAVFGPEEYARLLPSLAGASHPDSRRLTVLIGGPCPRAVIDRHFEVLPRAPLWVEFAAADGAMPWTVEEFSPGGPRPDHPGASRPVPGVQVQVVAPDGSPVPAGQTGEVRARGTSLPYGSIRSADGACLAEDTAPVLASGRFGRWRHNGTLEFCDPSPPGAVPPGPPRPAIP